MNVLEGSLDNKSIGPIILQPEHPYVFELVMSCKLVLFPPTLNGRWRSPKPSVMVLFSRRFLLTLMDSATLLVTISFLGFPTSTPSRLPYSSSQHPDRFDEHRRDTEVAPALLDSTFIQFFTTLMRSPDTARLIRSAYFRENVLQGNLSISDEQVTTSSAMALSSSIATTSDLTQADLYFESVANYGK